MIFPPIQWYQSCNNIPNDVQQGMAHGAHGFWPAVISGLNAGHPFLQCPGTKICKIYMGFSVSHFQKTRQFIPMEYGTDLFFLGIPQFQTYPCWWATSITTSLFYYGIPYIGIPWLLAPPRELLMAPGHSLRLQATTQMGSTESSLHLYRGSAKFSTAAIGCNCFRPDLQMGSIKIAGRCW